MTIPISDRNLQKVIGLLSIAAITLAPAFTYAVNQVVNGKDIERLREISSTQDLRIRALEEERFRLVGAITSLESAARDLTRRLDRVEPAVIPR